MQDKNTKKVAPKGASKKTASKTVNEIQRIGDGLADVERGMINMFPNGGLETVQGLRAYLLDYLFASFIHNNKDEFYTILKEYIKRTSSVFETDDMKALLKETYEKMGVELTKERLEESLGLCKQMNNKLYEEFDKLIQNKTPRAKKTTKKTSKKRGFKDAEGNFIEIS